LGKKQAMTLSREDVNSRVGVAAALAVAGAAAGLVAYFLDVYTDAKQNFVLWSLITAAGGFYVSSVVSFVKVITLRGRPSGNPGIGFWPLALYVFIHYTLAVFSTLLAVGMSDSSQELGGFAILMLIFALVNALGGALGGLLFGMILYVELSEKGWNSVASALCAGVFGIVEAVLCYVVQFNLGRLLLPNM
jgi:hypothetical protein